MENQQIKTRILRQLAQISKVAKATGIPGQVDLHYSGIHPDLWDQVLTSITEYKVYRHYVSVSDRLQVALLLD